MPPRSGTIPDGASKHRKKNKPLDAVAPRPHPSPNPEPPHSPCPIPDNGMALGRETIWLLFFPGCCFKATLPGCRGFNRPSLCIRRAWCDEPLKGAATSRTEIASTLRWCGRASLGGGGRPFSSEPDCNPASRFFCFLFFFKFESAAKCRQRRRRVRVG